MITENIKRFIEGADHAFVASAGKDGTPHLAAGRELQVTDPDHLLFEAWFCTTTLRNLVENPLVAVAITDPASGNGYQLAGRLERIEETAILDGYAADIEPGMPQVQFRLHLLIKSIMAFTAGAHTDQPLGQQSGDI